MSDLEGYCPLKGHGLYGVPTRPCPWCRIVELNDALLQEKLNNIGKVHPCDDQTAANLANVLAHSEATMKRIKELEHEVYVQSKAKHEAYETIRAWENKYEAAGAELEAQTQWRDVSSEPRDGTVVDIWCGKYKERLTNYKRIDLGKGNVFYDPVINGRCTVRTATHWMPIPPPPLEQTK